MLEGTILIVDDEPVIRDIFVKILSTNSQYKILTASNGKEALAIVEEDSPDLIFTDIKMPVMDGMQLLSALRSQDINTPVVIVSAHGEMEDVIAALRLGASNYLMKPNDISMLHSIAEKLLRVRKKEKLELFVHSYFQTIHEKYKIPSQTQLAMPLVEIVMDKIYKLKLFNESESMNLKIALDESLTNAIIHGNLELSSASKGKTLNDLIQFNDMIKSRSTEEPYKNRNVTFEYIICSKQVEFMITDEGSGFAWEKIPVSFETIDALSTHGRGLILIHTFMDQVSFNNNGTQIRMVKRCASSN